VLVAATQRTRGLRLLGGDEVTSVMMFSRRCDCGPDAAVVLRCPQKAGLRRDEEALDD